MRMRLAAAMILTGLAATANAQYQTRTWLEWRTIRTERFAVHYPRDLEAWARTVASKLEGIDSSVARVVGYQPGRRIEVVIDDPFTIPNGSAWPLIDAPGLVFWAAPPNPREDIGNYVSWADMLATHEFAHLAHLLRPSRNGFQTLLWRVAPVELGPISRKAPRWLIEGYATWVEGIITKSGRPNGVWRPAILRQWALEGVLPSYAQLNGANGMYGGEFAYLAGSAYIEWLVARRGDSSLVDLWRRMSARTDRGFAEAFAGVYGEPPDVLYGRFVAELTATAAVRRGALAGRDTGRTIQHLARETGDPAISADGGRVALVLASATRPGRVVVWSTLPEPDTLAVQSDRRLLAGDPLDVPPYRPFPAPKRALATLRAVGNQPYQDPRFFRDGRILVWRNTARGDGSWSPDLYAWDPQRNAVTRLTRGANLRQGDPSPDGRAIAATRCTGGHCDLVVVTRDGRDSIVIQGTDERSFYRPRFSADGQRILASLRTGGFWQVVVVDLADRSTRVITSGRTNFFDASFADDSTIVATSDASGVLEVVPIHLDGRIGAPITGVSGAAVAPEANPADGSVWFLSMHARGWDVRSVPRAFVARTTDTTSPHPVPAVPPASPITEPVRYSPRRKWIYFPGIVATSDGASPSLSFANTDPVGRTELLIHLAKSVASGSTGAGWEGGSATLTHRGAHPIVGSVFSVAQDQAGWRALQGFSASIEHARRLETRTIRALVGGSISRATTDYPGQMEERASRALAFVDAGGSATRFSNGRRSTISIGGSASRGSNGGFDFARFTGAASLASTVVPISVSAMQGRATTELFAEQFTLGGTAATLLPPGVMSQRIAMPAVAPVFVGKNVQTLRAAIPIAGGQVYSWAGRAWSTPAAPRFERVSGVEWSAAIAQISALGTPAARLTLGVGYWHDRPAIADGSAWRGYLVTQFGDWVR